VFFIAILGDCDIKSIMKPKRRPFTTTIQEDALKNIKKLAIDLDRPVNDLFEEAIEWLLRKYEIKTKKQHYQRRLPGDE